MKCKLFLKTICISLIGFAFLSINYRALAQDKENNLVNPGQYLYPQFTKGTVGMKAGKDLNLILNYNIVTEKLAFKQKGQIYDMIDFANVDTVTMMNTKFIFMQKVLMEVATTGKYTLMVQHTGSIQTPPKPGAYGTTSEVSSSSYINNIQIGNEVYRLQNDPGLIIKPENKYWLKSEGKQESFMNENQLVKLLPDLKAKIRKFIKDNHVKFEDQLSVARLISYCNTL